MQPAAMPVPGLRTAWSLFRSDAEPCVDAFRHSHAAPRSAQLARLLSILSAAKDTEFGREHGFASLASYEAYAGRVPPMAWSDMQSWIDKASSSDDNVLSAERPLFYEPTSGTGAACKLIPYTGSLLGEFQQALVVWLATLYDDCPDIAGGRSYWALSPPTPPHAPTANGTAVGGTGDAAYLADSFAAPLLGGVLNPGQLPPDSLAHPYRWQSLTLSAMIGAPDLRMISVWSPAFLLALLQPLETSAAAVDALQQLLDQRQRGMLEHALARGEFTAFWPDLAIISCWMDGPSERYLPTLRRWFPEARFSPKGLLATEGVVSISRGLSGFCPLALDSHFIEFADSTDRCVLADALVVGEQYRPLLTTSGGLYRYALGDVIEYEGERDGLRCVRFVGRSDARCDLAGEKLDESLVADACDALGEEGASAVLVPVPTQSAPGYALLTDDDDAATLAHCVDKHLMATHHYALARNMGQLAAVQPVPVADVSGLLQAAWHSIGRRVGDLKPARLVVSLPFADAIMALVPKDSGC